VRGNCVVTPDCCVAEAVANESAKTGVNEKLAKLKTVAIAEEIIVRRIVMLSLLKDSGNTDPVVELALKCQGARASDFAETRCLNPDYLIMQRSNITRILSVLQGKKMII
jgi:hypothetical protein